MTTDRREFIKKSLYAMLAMLGLGFLLPAMRLLAPLRTKEKELVFYPLIPEEEVPRKGVRKAELAYSLSGAERKMRVFLVASTEGLTVFSAVCSHLGCLVNFRRDKQEFVCPCHGGRYDIAGKNIAGPPPAPLTRLPIKREKGVVLVGVRA